MILIRSFLFVSTLILALGCITKKTKNVSSDDKGEEFVEKEEIKYFVGQYKDFELPEIDPNAPLKIPNQENLEILFKYLRKNTDQLIAEPDNKRIKKKLFIGSDNYIDFNKILDSLRLKPEFTDLSFSINKLTYNLGRGLPGSKPIRYTNIFRRIKLENAVFKSSKIDYVDFSESKLSNVTFSNNSMKITLCQKCLFKNVTIADSLVDKSDFSFSNGDIKFNNSIMKNSQLSFSKFSEFSYLGGSINNVNTLGSDKVNYSSETSVVSNDEKVALVFKSPFPGGTATKILNKILNQNYQLVLVEYGLGSLLIDTENLTKEVSEIFEIINSNGTNPQMIQFIEAFKKNPGQYSDVNKLYEYANKIVNNIDKLVIPGGLDIEPYFIKGSGITYRALDKSKIAQLAAKENIHFESNPIRTILEIFLLAKAIEKNKPVLAICRGAHLVNIYKGGKMLENLPNYYDLNYDNHVRLISKSSDAVNHKIVDLFNRQGNLPVQVYGNHHQAIDMSALPSDLNVQLIWQPTSEVKIAYAFVSKSKNIWMTQFHPEVKEDFRGGLLSDKLSNLNSEIFESFFELD